MNAKKQLRTLAEAAQHLGPPPICGRDPVLDAWADMAMSMVLTPLVESQQNPLTRFLLSNFGKPIETPTTLTEFTGSGIRREVLNPADDAAVDAFLRGETL